MDLMGRQVHTDEFDTVHVSDNGDATRILTHRMVQSETFSVLSSGVDDCLTSIAGDALHLRTVLFQSNKRELVSSPKGAFMWTTLDSA